MESANITTQLQGPKTTMKLAKLKAKTLKDYHNKYPARPGDTVAMFERYEGFCENNPPPKGDGYFLWYAKLAEWMERTTTVV